MGSVGPSIIVLNIEGENPSYVTPLHQIVETLKRQDKM